MAADTDTAADAEVHIDTQTAEAEELIEEALYACEDREQRGELLGIYRDVVGFRYRYFDDHEPTGEA